MQTITAVFTLQLVEGTYNDKVSLERLRGAIEEIIKVFLFLQGLLSALLLPSCPGSTGFEVGAASRLSHGRRVVHG